MHHSKQVLAQQNGLTGSPAASMCCRISQARWQSCRLPAQVAAPRNSGGAGSGGFQACDLRAAASTSRASMSSSNTSNSGSQRPQDTSSSQSSAQSSQQQQKQQQSQQSEPSFLSDRALTRKVLSASSASEVADLLLASYARASSGGNSSGSSSFGASQLVSEADAKAVVLTLVETGSTALALSIYREMRGAVLRRSGTSPSGPGSTNPWPGAKLSTTTVLVLALCRQLCTAEALQVISDLMLQGSVPSSSDVGFGKVIATPLPPFKPLAVVQPQEGAKIVADAYSKYEYEVFSGTVVDCRSEALLQNGNILLSIARALKLVTRPSLAALHEFVAQAPDGMSRTFRVATASADVPAQKGERVTIISSPLKNTARGSGFFNASPPGTKPGQAMSATNHKTGAVTMLLPPPLTSTQTGLPGWVLPAVVLLGGGDAATSLIDPVLPIVVAAGAVALIGGGVATRSLLVPRLKQLPENRLRLEQVRQQLLGQHSSLTSRVTAVMSEAAEDIRLLARLWQLQNKMEAVSGTGGSSTSAWPKASSAPSSAGASGSSNAGMGNSSSSTSLSTSAGYGARIERVAKARLNIEARLERKMELLEGYSRVLNMIEIEVEMDIEVPTAELAGIEQQMVRLVELEELQDDWKVQAEARDEVERLLRTV